MTEEKIRGELGCGDNFSDTARKAPSRKEITDQRDFTDRRNVCFVQDTVQRRRTQTTDWDKIFPEEKSSKGLLPKTHKIPLKPNN